MWNAYRFCRTWQALIQAVYMICLVSLSGTPVSSCGGHWRRQLGSWRRRRRRQRQQLSSGPFLLSAALHAVDNPSFLASCRRRKGGCERATGQAAFSRRPVGQRTPAAAASWTLLSLSRSLSLSLELKEGRRRGERPTERAGCKKWAC